jgi:Asparagine synthase
MDVRDVTGVLRRSGELTDVELAAGLAVGADPAAHVIESGPIARTPVAALEDALRVALQRSPCVISFSGGRDSSALLATATAVARRDGLPLPIPATLRFSDLDSDETEWQQLVIGHLGLDEWIRLDAGTSLGLLGPFARTVLERHGAVWPFNAHMHLPMIAAAAGGSIVTGFGGDELGTSSETVRAEQALARRRRPRRSDALVVGLALSPPPVREAVLRRRARAKAFGLGWLTRPGVEAVALASARNDRSIPLGWDRILRTWFPVNRYFTLCVDSFAAMGEAYDVRPVHPFIDRGVLDALARTGGFAGLGSRTQLMGRLFGDVLPAQLIQRKTKSSFDIPLWTAETKELARSWSGEGLNTDLIDVSALRHVWQRERPDMRTASLVQKAWLFDQR